MEIRIGDRISRLESEAAKKIATKSTNLVGIINYVFIFIETIILIKALSKIERLALPVRGAQSH